MMHVAPYHPPTAKFALGFAAILLLVWLAYRLRGFGLASPEFARRVVPAWLAGGTAFVMGAAWFELIGQIFVPHPIQPFWIVFALGIGWAVLAFGLFTVWSSRLRWSTVHRWSASFGATLACMTTPYLSISSWSKMDLVAVIFFDVLALVGILLLARKVFSASQVDGTAAGTR